MLAQPSVQLGETDDSACAREIVAARVFAVVSVDEGEVSFLDERIVRLLRSANSSVKYTIRALVPFEGRAELVRMGSESLGMSEIGFLSHA